ncbi:abortive infection family protein [Glaesserella parasuis]|uniref:abortive infection family protein n=1 Tax=Glaesserella parasuis TaxID=738 RepID=UPI001355E919|nr:abortive infection family protein [Glaesserella parasuis]MDD2174974.1 abortive infection family protein [Glaesserella parasuis]MDG6369621.1 abortive infection family protein [Glaesserella parasuis]MDG6793365.1 abortive infection family protein [Glaesserella parasuis]MDG6844512.1 abortive infection family protein [Glaesserella parasuis]MDG6854177.1 abortive infection family protein [Glaesserella parasuis]
MMKWLLNSIDKLPSLSVYQEHISEIENNIYRNPVLSVELCKSLSEGICKTILTDKGVSIPDKFPNLVSTTLSHLNVDNHPDARHIKELSKRLGSVLHYIAEIRNDCNYASHGQDIGHKPVSSDLALFVTHTTNAILGFILHFYIVTGDYQRGERIRYEDYKEFNDYLDEVYESNMGKIISFSRALFDQDIEAYKEEFLEYQSIEYERLQDTL